MWFDSAGWGVTPAAPLVTRPRFARSRPRGLRLLRFAFVLSVPPL